MNCSQCGIHLSESQQFCHQCGQPVNEPAASKSLSASQSRTPLIAKILLGAALACGLLYYAMTLTRNYHPVISDQPSTGFGTKPSENRIDSRKITAQIDGSDIIIPLSTVEKNGLVRFNDPEGIQTIPIIAYITPRGKIVTAMSISESCRSQDFYLQGYTIHCASCPSYWNMESLEAYACCQKYYPDPIHSTVERGYIRIPKQTVHDWRTRI